MSLDQNRYIRKDVKNQIFRTRIKTETVLCEDRLRICLNTDEMYCFFFKHVFGCSVIGYEFLFIKYA